MPQKLHDKENRDFLHDLATPMTVLRLVFKRIIDLQTSAEVTDHEKCAELLKKGLDQLLKMEDLHSDFKATLATRDSNNDNTNTKNN